MKQRVLSRHSYPYRFCASFTILRSAIFSNRSTIPRQRISSATACCRVPFSKIRAGSLQIGRTIGTSVGCVRQTIDKQMRWKHAETTCFRDKKRKTQSLRLSLKVPLHVSVGGLERVFVRAETGTWTRDLIITSDTLYQLSYFGNKGMGPFRGANIGKIFEKQNPGRRFLRQTGIFLLYSHQKPSRMITFLVCLSLLVGAHFTFCHLNMILSVYIFWVIFHNHPILFVFTWNIGCHCLTILLLMHLRQFNRISCSDELNQYTLFTRITIVSSFYYDYKSYTCMRKVLF